jgi:predicted DNA-binding transcriptional regulator YafY
VREAARVSSVVTAIRAGDRVESSRPASTRAQLTPSDALAVLREALDANATVVIEYVDNQGTRGERVVDPRSVDGGQLIAFDHRVGDIRGFAVHRIVSVRPA